MYRNVKQIIINKPRISVEINLFRANLPYPLFLAKREISFAKSHTTFTVLTLC